MDSPLPLPQPGWYLDPANEANERWWDGSGWTETTRVKMPQVLTSYAPPTTSTPPEYPSYQPVPGSAYYGNPVRTTGMSIAVLVLGIVSVALYPVIIFFAVAPAIVAVCLAPGAKREIAGNENTVKGSGLILAGVICSWISIGLTVAIFGFVFLALAL